MPDSLDSRLAFILSGQAHCDHYLTPIADPRGKRVLVLGAGAGTEMLWCFRNGAREVVGIDILEQSPEALELAAQRLGLDICGRFSFHMLSIDDAAKLGRRFELILSNNVFEHVSELDGAMRVCAELVEPNVGRVAIFTDPLFYSSAGSHLPIAPWEHLWEDGETIRQRLICAAPPHSALGWMTFEDFLHRGITLNRMRVADFLQAVAASGLAILQLRLIPDRAIVRLGEACKRVPGVAANDLAIEGIAVELAKLDDLNDVPQSRREILNSTPATAVVREAPAIAAAPQQVAEPAQVSRPSLSARLYDLGRNSTRPARIWLKKRFGINLTNAV
jgi:SAM-dependent methyltransferase